MRTNDETTEVDRVRRNTSGVRLQEIDAQIQDSVQFHATQPVTAITTRIQELDREWSIERWIETNASMLAFSGVVLGLTASKKWFALPLLVTGFLFQHALQGWCPPIPVLRRLGVRTRGEIDREKFALKMLRGDFRDVNTQPFQEFGRVNRILEAVNA